jgi:hypothetical protein
MKTQKSISSPSQCNKMWRKTKKIPRGLMTPKTRVSVCVHIVSRLQLVCAHLYNIHRAPKAIKIENFLTSIFLWSNFMPILPSPCHNRPTLDYYALCATLISSIRHRRKFSILSITPRHNHEKLNNARPRWLVKKFMLNQLLIFRLHTHERKIFYRRQFVNVVFDMVSPHLSKRE